MRNPERIAVDHRAPARPVGAKRRNPVRRTADRRAFQVNTKLIFRYGGMAEIARQVFRQRFGEIANSCRLGMICQMPLASTPLNSRWPLSL
jgi:hypothetical protein